MNHSETQADINFAYKVRHALNEQIDTISPETASRLAAARQLALSKKKADAPARVFAHQNVLAGHGQSLGNSSHFFQQPWAWLTRLGVAAPILAGIVMFSGLYQYEQQHHIKELASIDAAVLADEVPPVAYLDSGFDAYLSQNVAPSLAPNTENSK